MSWLFSYFTGGSGTESGISEPTDAERHRNQQIEGLRAAVLGVREVERDQQYRVDTVIKGEPIYLDIILPPQFPLTAPQITLSRPLQHPWIRDCSVCECPSLANYTVHSHLGEIVTEIIQELNDNSTVLPSHTPSLPPHPPSTTASIMSSPHSQPVLPNFHQRPPIGSYQPYYHYTADPQPPQRPKSPRSSPKPKRRAPPPPRTARRYTPPPVPTEFPTVPTMSNDELKRFLEDKDGSVLAENFVRNLDAVKKVQADRDLLFQENEDQAHINLGHEPELQNGWTRLQEKSFELMTEKERYDKQSREQQQIRDKFLNFGKTASSRLKSLAQEAETDSEIMVDDLLEGKTPVTDFIRDFQEKRKLHHLRMSKHEKLQYSSGRRH